jgi:hypothetical protein
MHKLIAGLAVGGAVYASSVALAQPDKPTIVLVHGAFAGHVQLEWRRQNPSEGRLFCRGRCQASTQREG